MIKERRYSKEIKSLKYFRELGPRSGLEGSDLEMGKASLGIVKAMARLSMWVLMLFYCFNLESLLFCYWYSLTVLQFLDLCSDYKEMTILMVTSLLSVFH